jgi:HSP20 family protein
MSNVSIEKIHEPERGAVSLFTEMEKMTDAIRRRAFDHFLDRGNVFGNDLEDWLRAERELIWSPGAEMTDNEKEVTLRVQAPGFEPNDLKITATPASVLIEGETHHQHQESKGTLRFCEFGQKLFRRFDLPDEINVDKVAASLDKGILQIVAPKAHGGQKGRTVPVTARASG